MSGAERVKGENVGGKFREAAGNEVISILKSQRKEFEVYFARHGKSEGFEKENTMT